MQIIQGHFSWTLEKSPTGENVKKNSAIQLEKIDKISRSVVVIDIQYQDAFNRLNVSLILNFSDGSRKDISSKNDASHQKSPD